jgi:hypothetical protein
MGRLYIRDGYIRKEMYVRQTVARISARPTFSVPEALQNPPMKMYPLAVIAIGVLGIAIANAQQAIPPSSGASPVNKGVMIPGSKPPHGDHCRDTENAASSGKTDCPRSSASDAGGKTRSSSSASSAPQPADTSSRHTPSSSANRSASSSRDSTPPSSPTPGAQVVPPGAHPAPPTPNEASSARAQTPPRPVEHEPPANGPGKY